MKGILIYDKGSAFYNKSGIAIYLEQAKILGISLQLVYYEDITYGICKNQYYVKWKECTVSDIVFAINRCRDYRLAKHLEEMGIRVFNNSKVNRIGNHKWETYDFLSRFHIPMPDTCFLSNDKIKNYLLNCKNTVVVKAVRGHGGSQVCLFEPNKLQDIEQIYAIMGREDVVVQPYLPGKGQDLRVYVMGNAVIGAVLRSATKDFRSNYSLGGEASTYTLKGEELILVNRIIDCFSFDYVGIDFLIQEDGSLLFNEIEDVVGARMLYECTNLDAIRLYMKYIYDTLK